MPLKVDHEHILQGAGAKRLTAAFFWENPDAMEAFKQ